MAQFVHYDTNHGNDGFDAAAQPPWLMVPLGKSNKVRFRDHKVDKGWDFEVPAGHGNKIDVKAKRSKANYIIEVKGKQIGSVMVQARNRHARALANLQVAVLPCRPISVVLVLVEDAKGRTPALPVPDRVFKDNIGPQLNTIFEPQANVKIEKAYTLDRKYDRDLGDEVVWETHKGFFLRKRITGADFTVFIVKQVRAFQAIAPGATSAAGVALGNEAKLKTEQGQLKLEAPTLDHVVRDQAGIASRKYRFAVADTASRVAPLEWVVAHELGHLLGMGHTPTQGRLMYKSTSGAGSKIGRDEVLRAHQLLRLKVCQ